MPIRIDVSTDPAPELGEAMSPASPSAAFRDALLRRRSTAADFLGGEGPSTDVLDEMLTIASRVPDHRRVTPFRFILFEGEGRKVAGDILAEVFQRREPDADHVRVEKERARFLRAPLIVGVVAKTDPDHRTPEWEQLLTVGAVCMNLLHAASAHGFAAQWLTEWYAYDGEVVSQFGVGAGERIAGFIYVGAASEDPLERPRPALEALIERFVSAGD